MVCLYIFLIHSLFYYLFFSFLLRMTNLPRKTQLLSSFALTSVAENLRISKKSTISQYFSTTNCITECGNQTRKGICENCLQKPQMTLVKLHDKITKLEKRYDSVTRVNIYYDLILCIKPFHFLRSVTFAVM